MIEIFSAILSADRGVYIVSLALVAVATILMTERFEHASTGVAFAPGLLMGALTGAYVSELFGLGLSSDKMANAAVAAAFGMIAALFVMLFALRIIMAASGMVVQRASRKMTKRVEIR